MEIGVNKEASVQVRLTLDELKRWLAAAMSEDRSLSNWIRHHCDPVAIVAQPSVEIVKAVEKKFAERKKVKR